MTQVRGDMWNPQMICEQESEKESEEPFRAAEVDFVHVCAVAEIASWFMCTFSGVRWVGNTDKLLLRKCCVGSDQLSL